jgi:hypothetical protein
MGRQSCLVLATGDTPDRGHLANGDTALNYQLRNTRPKRVGRVVGVDAGCSTRLAGARAKAFRRPSIARFIGCSAILVRMRRRYFSGRAG